MAKSLAERLVATINKEFKGGAGMAGSGRSRSEITAVIPTGITPVDHYVIGCGGFPCGRLTELFSEEGGGKSSLVYAALAGAQRIGGTAVLIESEASFTKSRASTFGVDVDNLVLVEAGGDATALSIEDVMLRIEAIAKSLDKKDGPVLVAWDSLAATPTNSELANGIIGSEKVAERAKVLSRACRVLAGLASRHNIALLVVNQTRATFGGGWGGPSVTTPGGAAIKFYASLRLQIMGGAAVKEGTRHVGKDITVIAPKNKMASPWRKARVRLAYDQGWDDVWTTVSLAKDLGLVAKGARYTQEVADGVRDALLANLKGEPDA